MLVSLEKGKAMKYAIIVLAFVGVLARPTAAIANTADVFLKACKNYPEYCAFYAVGWSDGHAMAVLLGGIAEEKIEFCIPDGTTATQMGDALIKYIQDHPKFRDFRMDLLTRYAFKKAFPC